MMLKVLRRLRSRSQPTTDMEQTAGSKSHKKNQPGGYKPRTEIDYGLERMLEDFQNDDSKPGCSEEECCVCIVKKAVVMAMPCGHRVTCRECCVTLLQQAISKTSSMDCVICRTPIYNFGLDRIERRSNISQSIPVPCATDSPRVGRRGLSAAIDKLISHKSHSTSPPSTSSRR